MEIKFTQQHTAIARLATVCAFSLFFASCVTDKAAAPDGVGEPRGNIAAVETTKLPAEQKNDAAVEAPPAQTEEKRSVAGRILDTVSFKKDKPEEPKPAETTEPAPVAAEKPAASAVPDSAAKEAAPAVTAVTAQTPEAAPKSTSGTCPFKKCSTLCKLRIWLLAAILVVGAFLLKSNSGESPATSGALTRQCHENIEALAELLNEYKREHGDFPSSLQELVPTGLGKLEAFTCGAVGTKGAEMIVQNLEPEAMRDVIPIRKITYLYFPAGFRGMRIICPAWHQDNMGVDLLGNVVHLSRERWEELADALAAAARE